MSKKGISLLQTAKKYEEESQFWEASEEYKNALLEFDKESGFKTEKTLCKKKIREMNKEKSGDFVETSASHTFTSEESKILDNLINSFVDCEKLEECLYKIGKEFHFQPNYKKIKEDSEHNMPVSFMIASLSSQDDQGNLSQDGHDPAAMSFSMNYAQEQGGIVQMYLRHIFARLMDNGMKHENLADYFESKNIFSKDTSSILRVGIERFFAEDYVSALHILVPRFEGVFLDLTEAVGEVDVVASRKQYGSSDQVWTQDRTLGENFLKKEEVRAVWGEDFCEQIIFTFFSPLGSKLRHKIAHGYSQSKELNFANCVLVLYFFLVLASMVKRVPINKD